MDLMIKNFLYKTIGLILLNIIFFYIFKFIWPPLLMFIWLVSAGSLIMEIRVKMININIFIGTIISGLYGTLIGMLVFYGSDYTKIGNLLSWFFIIIGIITAGYIGFRTENELIFYRNNNKKYIFSSIVFYLITLLSLNTYSN
jgi:hypothetical protein